jgi:hypothetical protein
MEYVIAISILAGYFIGGGKLIRWACRENRVDVPSWLDVCGWLLIPAMLARFARWLIPDSLGWPENWIAIAIWMSAHFATLRWWYQLPLRWALGVWAVVMVLACVMTFRAVTALPDPKGSASPAPATTTPQP